MRLFQNNPFREKLTYILAPFIIISLIGMYLAWDFLFFHRPFGIRLLFDDFDINVYFQSSRWIVGEGILYKDVFSEYPLLANLIFGYCRLVAKVTHPFPSDIESFSFVWTSTSFLLYLFAIFITYTKVSRNSLWLWIAPASVYFALFRFDIYPSVTTLLALMAIRDEKYTRGSIWLGITIALKGYAIFLLPSYCIFIFYKRGIKAVITNTIICFIPFLAGNLMVLLYAGLQGLLAPYAFHGMRGPNGESTYDVFRLSWIATIFPGLPPLLQISSSLLPVLKKPKTFESLVDAFLIAIVGFITFSVFYSPQYFLWIIPIAVFSESLLIRKLTVAFSWVAFFYFPIAYDMRNRELAGRILFRVTITLSAVIRLALLVTAIKRDKGILVNQNPT